MRFSRMPRQRVAARLRDETSGANVPPVSSMPSFFQFVYNRKLFRQAITFSAIRKQRAAPPGIAGVLPGRCALEHFTLETPARNCLQILAAR
jgi:hypothetical protein